MNVLARVVGRAAAGVVALALCDAPMRAEAGQPDLDARIRSAFDAAYNLDHETALATARRAAIDAPNESRAHRALAGILWLQALFHRGALTVDHYMGGLTRSTVTLPKPPAAIEQEFTASITRAIELADARLDRAPRDPDALYDAGAAYGLRASWIASVEGNVRGAFRTARRAFLTQKKVLDVAPDRVGAGAVVGTYRYAIAGLGFAPRMFAYLVGFEGGKDEGIALLEAAAGPGSSSRHEARTALVLIYSREGRHEDAFALLTEMAAAFPGNRILVLERGAAAVRAGRAFEADAILSAGIATFDSDPRRKLRGERALWFYRRGLARLALVRPEAASADLETALESGPEEWIRGRIELGLGKVADLGGRRAEALERYTRARDIARAANDPAGLAEANRLIDRPFQVTSRRAVPGRTVKSSRRGHRSAWMVV